MRIHRHFIRQIVDWKDVVKEWIESTTFSTLTIGDDSNYTEFESDGTLVQAGDATTWEDIQTSLIGRRLYSTSGRVDYDYDENAIEFQDSGSLTNINNRVSWSVQRPHKSKDSTLNVHVHWEQPNSTVRTWSLAYRIQDNGSAKTTAWTTVNVNTGGSNDAFTYTSGTLNQITSLAQVDMSGSSLSAVIQFRLARTDTNGGTILATFVDAHYEADTLGSNTEFVK